jgi:hypothetical protein
VTELIPIIAEEEVVQRSEASEVHPSAFVNGIRHGPPSFTCALAPHEINASSMAKRQPLRHKS